MVSDNIAASIKDKQNIKENEPKVLKSIYEKYRQYPDISIDSRKINKHCIFFALKGPNFNANEFASIAIDKGASYAIVDEQKYVLKEYISNISNNN